MVARVWSKGTDLRPVALASWVQIPHHAPAIVAQSAERTPFKRVVVGSSPTVGTQSENDLKLKTAVVAQLVERTPFKRVVVGSSPTVGKRYIFLF